MIENRTNEAAIDVCRGDWWLKDKELEPDEDVNDDGDGMSTVSSSNSKLLLFFPLVFAIMVRYLISPKLECMVYPCY